MATLDDIDDDEAFINELMAMHPNDEDIVVEDLEGVEAAEDLRVLQEGLTTTEGVIAPEVFGPPEDLTTPEPPADTDDDGDGVRMRETGVFPLYCSLVRSWSFALLPAQT